MTFNDLLRLARHSGQLMAEDKSTGVRVELSRSMYGHYRGFRVRCFVQGQPTVEREARKAQEGV